MIETGYFWRNVFLLAIGTFAIRGSIIALSSRVPINERWKELFSFIPAAILPAFVAPAVFLHAGKVEWFMGKERTIALLASLLICLTTRSTLATIVSGLGLLYGLNLFLGAG